MYIVGPGGDVVKGEWEVGKRGRWKWRKKGIEKNLDLQSTPPQKKKKSGDDANFRERWEADRNSTLYNGETTEHFKLDD